MEREYRIRTDKKIIRLTGITKRLYQARASSGGITLGRLSLRPFIRIVRFERARRAKKASSAHAYGLWRRGCLWEAKRP